MWLSVDPLAQKGDNMTMSPYSFVANNPIMQVDPDGRDNVIYMLYMPSAQGAMSKADAQKMVGNANTALANLGLNTRVQFVDMTTENNCSVFDPSQIDNTDAIAVLGFVSEVTNYISQNDQEFGKELRDEGWGGKNNPELSENSSRRGENHGGEWIALDATALEGTAEMFLSDKVETGMFLMLHGAGHNTGFNHRGDRYRGTGGSMMKDGQSIYEGINCDSGDIYESLYD